MRLTIVSGIGMRRSDIGQLIFPLSLVTVPEFFAEVNLVQFPCRCELVL